MHMLYACCIIYIIESSHNSNHNELDLEAILLVESIVKEDQRNNNILRLVTKTLHLNPQPIRRILPKIKPILTLAVPIPQHQTTQNRINGTKA